MPYIGRAAVALSSVICLNSLPSIVLNNHVGLQGAHRLVSDLDNLDIVCGTFWERFSDEYLHRQPILQPSRIGTEKGIRSFR